MIAAVGGGFDGEAITSNARALLLRETDRAIGLIDRSGGGVYYGRALASGCDARGRDPDRAAHRGHRAGLRGRERSRHLAF